MIDLTYGVDIGKIRLMGVLQVPIIANLSITNIFLCSVTHTTIYVLFSCKEQEGDLCM